MWLVHVIGRQLLQLQQHRRVPMQKQGSIILGTSGDNSDGDGGRFFEGVMVSGAATLATVNAVQANIVAAAYGK
jgi:hypothetical protein